MATCVMATTTKNHAGDHGGEPSARPEFLRLLLENQRRVFAYILTLVPNRNDAEDILQDTSVVLWEKFDEFRPGTDFVAWGCRIAYLKVQNFYRKQGRSKVTFNDEVLALVSHDATEAAPELNERHEHLRRCLEKLSERDRTLVMARYEAGGSPASAAEQASRPIKSVYQSLIRIRRALFDCVSNSISQELA